MATFFEIGLANAVVATLLGLGIYLLGQRLRRPAVIHGLWIIVLAKLITPPLFPLPISGLELSQAVNDSEPMADPNDAASTSTKRSALASLDSRRDPKVPQAEEFPPIDFQASAENRNVKEEHPFPELSSVEQSEAEEAADVGPSPGSTSQTLVFQAEVPVSPLESAGERGSQHQTWTVPVWVVRGLMGVWVLGSFGYLGLIAVRVRRFRRLLKQSSVPASEELMRELKTLARSMGLTSVPGLVLVPGAVSPLVWALGSRAVIVFPKSLLAHLDGPGRRSLLLHELTHLRRRDHWVRALELLVGCLYWWLPLVWLARREIQQAEEECCDAWVVWWMQGERRPYAKALLTTLDFLAGATPEIPPAASGLGHLAFLRQRLQGILKADVPRSLGWRGAIGVAVCGLAVLPVIPTWGQSESNNDAPAPAEKSADEPETAAPTLASIVVKQFGYQTSVSQDPVEFESKPVPLQRIVENAQGSAFSGDGRRLVTVYGRTHETGEVRIWDVEKRTEQVMWTEPEGIRVVAMAPDGKTFAYGTYGGVIKLGDVETGRLRPAWEPKTSGVESIAFSSDGRFLATGESDGLAHIWEVATGKIIQTCKGHTGHVYGIGFLGDEKTIVTNGRDRTLRYWERSTGKLIRSIDHPNQMFTLAVAPDGKMVATGCTDGKIRLFVNGQLKIPFDSPGGATSVAFHPEGKLLAVSGGRTVTIWEAKEGEGAVDFSVGQRAVIDTNHGNVHHVTFSPDGKTLATTSWDRSVKLWNVETQAELGTLMPAADPGDKPEPVLGAAWSPDNSLLATVHEDRSIRIRNGSTGEVVATLSGHEDVVSDLKFSPDGKLLATASNDHTLKLWRISPEEKDAPIAGEPIHTLQGHDNWVMCVAFSPDGTKLASGSYDRTIRLWDAKEGKLLKTLKGHAAAVRSVVFVSENRLASAGSDRSVRLWNVADAKELAVLKEHKGAVRALAYSPRTKTLASASEDKTINLWDLSQFKSDAEKPIALKPRTLEGHAGLIWSLAFSPGGTVLASGDLTGQIKLWNPTAGKQRQSFQAHQDIATTLAFSQDGSLLLSGGFDGRLLLWKGQSPMTTIRPITTISTPENRVRVGAISPDGRWLALGGGTRQIELYDLKQLKDKPLLIDHGRSTSHLAFSPDNRWIAVGTYTGQIRIWDVQKKRWLPDLPGHEGQVQRVTFSPDGNRLASVGWDHVMKLWDLAERKLIATSPKQPLLLSDVAFSPDGKTIATSSGNWKTWQTPGEVKLWSADPLKELKVLGGHEQEIRGLVFTPDGNRLVSYSSSSNGTTCVWDLKTGKELGRFAGASSLTLLPDGRHAITGGLYGKMAVWDIQTFKRVSDFTGHSDLVYTLSHSPDGSLLASVCRDGAVTLWPTSPDLGPPKPAPMSKANPKADEPEEKLTKPFGNSRSEM